MKLITRTKKYNKAGRIWLIADNMNENIVLQRLQEILVESKYDNELFISGKKSNYTLIIYKDKNE